MSRRGLKMRRVISGPKDLKAALITKRPLPSDEILSALYNELMMKMDLPPDKVVEMNRMSREQKWSLVCAQHEMREGASSVYYVEQLVRHAQPELKEKKVKNKLLDKLQPLSTVLKQLEVDIRTSTSVSWVSEFVGLPNLGHVALMDLVRDFLLHPNPVPRKNSRKYNALDRNSTTLYLSLLCVRALMSHRSGFNAVLSYEPSLCTLTHCLTSRHARITTLILKLLTSVLLAPGGQVKILQAFDYLRTIAEENKRFQTLILSLTDIPVNSAYQAEALRFINTVVHTAPGPNARVFHQYEFIDAGLSVADIEQTLQGHQDERIVHELREWERNFTDVQKLMDDLVLTRGRNEALKEEVNEALTQLREVKIERDNLHNTSAKLKEKLYCQKETLSLLREKIIDLETQLKQLDQLHEINKRYHAHTMELKEKIAELMEENTSVKANHEKLKAMLGQVEKMNVDGANLAELAIPKTLVSVTEGVLLTSDKAKNNAEKEDEEEEMANGNQNASSIPKPPPLPPILGELGPGIPAPPPLPGIGELLKKPYVPNVPLPMLNWIPIRNAQHTIFQDMSDETIVEEVDFSEFEALFQTKRLAAKQSRAEVDEEVKVIQLDLFDNKRQRGIVFAKRRIRLDPGNISQFILNTDLDGLLSEHCELLLQIVPQEKERDTLAKNSDRRDEFGEAEEFLYQLARIPRLEQRLSVMFYMGSFDELLSTTKPKVDAVLQSSLSILRSARLKKAFEIILAFGNYMNSKRRGLAYGFKLESLEKLLDTKTQDRKQTLLNYITHIVETLYPNVLSFYEDLSINDACEVAMETVDSDFENLQQGLRVVEEEQQRDAHNFILFSFYKQARKKVAGLTNSHQKMKDAYREACLMFCESPKTDPSTFFVYFKMFINNWKKAISENHSRKRRKMAPAEALLKKQSQQEVLKNIAVQAAQLVATRKDYIAIPEEDRVTADVSEKRKTAERLSRKALNADASDQEGLGKEGETEEKNLKAEIEEEELATYPKSLKDRVPWLAANMKSNPPEKKRRVGIVEKPVLEDLEEKRELDIEIIPPPPQFLSSHIQNGSTEPPSQHSALPKLPKKDYPASTAAENKTSTRIPTFPLQNYPSNKLASSQHHSSASKTQPKGVQMDDDYYTQMMMDTGLDIN